jgi:hypothetical protein
MNSNEYQELQRRLAELKTQFMEFEIPIDRNATSTELDRIAAFKLLMHAEIETFIEDRILRAINENSNQWVVTKVVSRPQLNLLLRWSEHSTEEDRFRDAHDRVRLDELVVRCEKRARDEVRRNNSIKKDAFLRMCCSAGLTVQDLDSTLLAELDSFGKTRGDVAHKGAGKVRVLNAPAVEVKSVENIVSLLGQFDLDIASVTPTSR